MVGISHNFAEVAQNLEGQIAGYSFNAVSVAAIAVIILVILGMQLKNRVPRLKIAIFLLISTIVSFTTLFLVGSTVYLNVVSDSGGPVHWHADIEYWACDTEIELRDPYKFLSNKIGSATLHEHNDKRIHLEGVVVDEEIDASLGHFMKTIDGNLDRGTVTIPVHQEYLADDDVDGDEVSTENLQYLESLVRGSGDSRYLDLKNGDTCGEGVNAPVGEVQVFVYKFNEDNDTYEQTKLEDPASYIYSPYSNVPPGDCIIVEFDTTKDFTDKLCMQYGLKDSKRCTEFGVLEYNPDLCDIVDVTDYSLSESRNEVNVDNSGDFFVDDNVEVCEAGELCEVGQPQENAGVQ